MNNRKNSSIDETNEGEHYSPKFHKHLKRVVLLVFSILLVIGMIYYIGFDKFVNNLTKLKIEYLLIIIIIYSGAWLLRATRLYFFIRKLSGKISFKDAFQINIGSNALNLILPVRLGDVSGTIALRKYIPFSKSVASVLHTRILDFMALLIFATFVLIFIKVPSWAFGAFVFSLLIIGGVTGFVMISNRTPLIENLTSKFANKFIKRAEKSGRIYINVADFIKGFTKNYEKFLSIKLILLGVVISLGIWSADSIICYLIALGIGYQIEIQFVIMAIVFANFVKAAPTTPGDIGVFEGALAILLIFNNVSPDIAVTIAVVHHLILNLFTLIVGIPGIFKITSCIVDIDSSS